MVSEPDKISDGKEILQQAAPSLKDRAESLVAWAAIAYAGGFLTVMLHTARLGIPVIQLIEPINVWIGLPLAAVVMVSRHLWKTVRRENATLKQRFKKIGQQFRELKDSPTIAVVNRFTGSLLELLPLGWLLKWFYDEVVSPNLDRYIIANPETVRAPDKWLRWVHRMNATAQATGAALSYFNTLLGVSLIPLGLFLYVWVAYPEIPQEYGGGRPTTVQLAISSDATPANGSDFSALFALPSPATEPTVRTTVPVRLLFATDDYWYLQLDKGHPVVAIRSEKISAVIWRKSAGMESISVSPPPSVTPTPSPISKFDPIPTPSPTAGSPSPPGPIATEPQPVTLRRPAVKALARARRSDSGIRKGRLSEFARIAGIP